MDATLTLAALFTAGGAVTAAVLIREWVELLKGVFPAISARVSGEILAFFSAAVVYILAFAAVGPFTPEAGFQAALAWLACAVGAVGINATVDHVVAVRAPSPAISSTEPPTDAPSL
jgi:hypothetical protein